MLMYVGCTGENFCRVRSFCRLRDTRTQVGGAGWRQRDDTIAAFACMGIHSSRAGLEFALPYA